MVNTHCEIAQSRGIHIQGEKNRWPHTQISCNGIAPNIRYEKPKRDTPAPAPDTAYA
jgi:hypothetical protein